MYGTAKAKPKWMMTGTASSLKIKPKFISLMPSLYALSIAFRKNQSGPIIVMAQAIFVYSTPKAQSCQMNRIGVWCMGTRNGIMTTSSNSNPNNNGMTPRRRTLATNVFKPSMHHCFKRCIIAALPCGNHPTTSVMARAFSQHRYKPHAAVYNSCTLTSVCASEADSCGPGGGAPTNHRAITLRPNHTGNVSAIRLDTISDMQMAISRPKRRAMKNDGFSYGMYPET